MLFIMGITKLFLSIFELNGTKIFYICVSLLALVNYLTLDILYNNKILYNLPNFKTIMLVFLGNLLTIYMIYRYLNIEFNLFGIISLCFGNMFPAMLCEPGEGSSQYLGRIGSPSGSQISQGVSQPTQASQASQSSQPTQAVSHNTNSVSNLRAQYAGIPQDERPSYVDNIFTENRLNPYTTASQWTRIVDSIRNY